MKYNLPLPLTSYFSLLFIYTILFPHLCLSQISQSPNIRVKIGLNQDSVIISAITNWTIYDENQNPIYYAKAAEVGKISADFGNLKLNDGQNLRVSSILVIASSGFPLKVKDRYYRGRIKIKVQGVNKIEVINELNLEEYLYGVLPQEISPKWPLEAQKSQAIVARTFALFRMEKNKDKDYDLTDRVSDQVYCGYSCENAISNYAVDTTKGFVVVYNDKLAYTIYHADAGGATENVEEVWGEYLPYLRSVPSYEKDSPFRQWSIEITRSQMSKLLPKFGIKAKEIYGIKILTLSSTGRIKLLQIIHSEGVTEISGEKFRSVLGYDFLRSTKFKIKEEEEKTETIFQVFDLDKELIVLNGWGETDKKRAGNLALITKPTHSPFTFPEKITIISAEKVPAKYQFSGQGWGHGVGMSQWGAKQLAQEGWTYQQIIKHYYTGVEIRKWY